MYLYQSYSHNLGVKKFAKNIEVFLEVEVKWRTQHLQHSS